MFYSYKKYVVKNSQGEKQKNKKKNCNKSSAYGDYMIAVSSLHWADYHLFIMLLIKTMTFLTDASTTMWGGSIPEGVDVWLDLLQICQIIKRKPVTSLNFLQTVADIYKPSIQQISERCSSKKSPAEGDRSHAHHFLTNLVVGGPFSQQLSIVDPLSSRQDLLTPHEHVVRVRVFLKKKQELSFSENQTDKRL